MSGVAHIGMRPETYKAGTWKAEAEKTEYKKGVTEIVDLIMKRFIQGKNYTQITIGDLVIDAGVDAKGNEVDYPAISNALKAVLQKNGDSAKGFREFLAKFLNGTFTSTQTFQGPGGTITVNPKAPAPSGLAESAPAPAVKPPASAVTAPAPGGTTPKGPATETKTMPQPSGATQPTVAAPQTAAEQAPGAGQETASNAPIDPFKMMVSEDYGVDYDKAMGNDGVFKLEEGKGSKGAMKSELFDIISTGMVQGLKGKKELTPEMIKKFNEAIFLYCEVFGVSVREALNRYENATVFNNMDLIAARETRNYILSEGIGGVKITQDTKLSDLMRAGVVDPMHYRSLIRVFGSLSGKSPITESVPLWTPGDPKRPSPERAIYELCRYLASMALLAKMGPAKQEEHWRSQLPKEADQQLIEELMIRKPYTEERITLPGNLTYITGGQPAAQAPTGPVKEEPTATQPEGKAKPKPEAKAKAEPKAQVKPEPPAATGPKLSTKPALKTVTATATSMIDSWGDQALTYKEQIEAMDPAEKPALITAIETEAKAKLNELTRQFEKEKDPTKKAEIDKKMKTIAVNTKSLLRPLGVRVEGDAYKWLIVHLPVQ